MGQYFISYSRRDFYFAESLFYALHGKGVNAWMDVWKIVPGDNWDDALSQAIHSSQGLILVASKDALRSPNVRDEICQAREDHIPIYLVVRGGVSDQDLFIAYEHPRGTPKSIDLRNDVTAIIDMRSDFSGGVEKLAACLFKRALYRDRIPVAFSFRMERILYIPPILVALVLMVVLTEIVAYGIEIFYLDGIGQLMAYLRDAVQGRVGEIILLVPGIVGAIVTYGALVNVIVFGVNFARRKRVTANQFYLLLASSVIMLGTVLLNDATAVVLDFIARAMNSAGAFLHQGERAPGLELVPIVLLIFHVVVALLVAALGAVFVWMVSTQEGKGAILRWLPTGYASNPIRREGNWKWIRSLPDIPLAPAPSYGSYFVVASPADDKIAAEIRSMLQRRDYHVTDDPLEAACDLVILSPSADDSLLQSGREEEQSRPVIYVLGRSMKLGKDASIALQWIDYRRPSDEQFWKQWAKRFSNLTTGQPVFPYVPESLANAVLPRQFGCGVGFLMLMFMAGVALLVGEYEYVTLVQSAPQSLRLLVGIACLLLAGCIGYYAVTQILRTVISPSGARRWLRACSLLMLVAAFLTQSGLLIMSAIGVALVSWFAFSIAYPSLRRWLPASSRASRGKWVLRPISARRAMAHSAFTGIMIFGFLLVNSVTTDAWIAPRVPQQSASKPYAVTVPGPYYLATPGSWSQDPYANVYGYHFDYQPDDLEVSQNHATGYPTWIKFYGVSSSPMRFAPHFISSVHIHFSDSDLRTDVGLVLNDFVGDPRGPQIRLSASGLWLVVESNGKHYSAQLSPKELSHDYTVKVEVNGILCIYSINGVEVTELADDAASSVKDIMLSLSNLAPGGAKWSLSNFTYTPLPGPALSRNEALQRISALRMIPYKTVAPGWTCNPTDGRWDASFEPAQPSSALTCTSRGTLLKTSSQQGVLLYFTNGRYGEFPSAFDYAFHATFESSGDQCMLDGTYANATVGKLYLYTFEICSDGTWTLRYAGFYPDSYTVFLNRQLSTGHATIHRTVALSAEVRGTNVTVYLDGQLITSYEDPGLIPSVLFFNPQGAVLYSDFTYTPKT